MKRLARTKACLLLALTLALSACTDTAEKPGEVNSPEWLGRVNGLTVSQLDLEGVAQENYNRGVSDMEPEDRISLLQWLLVRKALAARAEEGNVVTAADVEKALLLWKLKTYPDLYISREIDPKVEVTEEELWGYVDPQESHLLSAIVFEAGEEGKEEAWEVHGILTAGGDFPSVAKERSRGILRSRGGDMGWQTIPNFSVDEASAEIVRAMQPGKFTEPLETQIGWIIYQLRAYESREGDFARRKDKLRGEVQGQKIGEARERKVEELKEKASVVIHLQEGKAIEGGPLAIVDGFMITHENLEGESHAFGDVLSVEQRLNKFIRSFLLVREAERIGFDKEEVLAARLETVRTAYLADMAINDAVAGKISVSDDEVAAEYERAYLPEVYQLQAVMADSRERADEAFRELESGREFGEISKEYGIGQLAEQSGLLPRMGLADFQEDLREEVESLQDGGYTRIHDRGDGMFLIVKRLGMTTIEVPPLEAVQGRIRSKLALQERSRLVTEAMETFISEMVIEINEDLLEQM